jgi:hypothetical protein
MATSLTNDTVVSNTTQAIEALAAHLSKTTEIPVAGKMLTVAEIAEVFREAIKTRTAVIVAQGKYKEALAKRDEAESTRRVHEDALKAWVLNRFTATSSQAHAFGYVPRIPAEPSAETKAKAVLLNKATRDARGTKGKKAKLAIKGTLDTEMPASVDPDERH